MLDQHGPTYSARNYGCIKKDAFPTYSGNIHFTLDFHRRVLGPSLLSRNACHFGRFKFSTCNRLRLVKNVDSPVAAGDTELCFSDFQNRKRHLYRNLTDHSPKGIGDISMFGNDAGTVRSLFQINVIEGRGGTKADYWAIKGGTKRSRPGPL